MQSRPNQHSGLFFTVSFLLHAALLLFLPDFGVAPGPFRLENGAKVDVTVVETTPVKPTAVSKPVTTTKPIVEPKPKPAPATAKKTAVVSPKTVAHVQPKVVRPTVRVFTSSNSTERSVISPEVKQKVEPERTQPEPIVKQTEAPPGPPIASELVGGFGAHAKYPAKEAASISQGIQLKVTVLVPAKGMPTGRVIGTTGSDDLDRWVMLWATKRLEYKPLANEYEVTVEAVINPVAQTVSFHLATPNERVRIIQP